MTILGVNGTHVDTDAVLCQVTIDGHYLKGNTIPAAQPPIPNQVYDYINTDQDTLYHWNPVTHRWNLDFSHVYNIQEFTGGIADGVSDNTAAAQAAVNAMPPTGGILYLPPMPDFYRISTVNIFKPVIVIGGGMGGTRIKKFGPSGVSERAIFVMKDRLDIGFSMQGLHFDLNGEGSERMGDPGRIPNATAVAAGITSVSGPPNSAVFALRCSRLYVADCRIEHTAEVGLLFRNCADVYVRDTTFYNTANGGIEFSFPTPATDGGLGPLPVTKNYHVRGCRFEDIEDFGLGSRNAVGVSFAGNIVDTAIQDVFVVENTFSGCQRDIHVEFQNTSRIERFRFSGNTMRDSRQGSIAIIRGRDGDISDNTIINPCGAPTAALNPGFPEMYALYIAVGDGVVWRNNRVYDRRETKSEKLLGSASMSAGSNVVTATTPVFTSALVGTWFGILGAGPSGSPLVGKVISVVSPTELAISVAAQNPVLSADIAYGGAVRRGFVTRVSNNATFIDNILVGTGHYSNLSHGATLEPPSYAVYVADIYQFATVKGNIVRAASPSIVGADSPEGIRVAQSISAQGRIYVRDNSVQGYDDNHSGFNLTEPTFKHAHRGRKWFLVPVYPDAVAATYGLQVAFIPLDTGFDLITDFEIEVDGMGGGEVVDVHTRSLMDNGSDQNVTVQFTANGAVRYSAQRLALINRDNRILNYFYVEVRSSIPNSTARARITALALEH